MKTEHIAHDPLGAYGACQIVRLEPGDVVAHGHVEQGVFFEFDTGHDAVHSVKDVVKGFVVGRKIKGTVLAEGENVPFAAHVLVVGCESVVDHTLEVARAEGSFEIPKDAVQEFRGRGLAPIGRVGRSDCPGRGLVPVGRTVRHS